MTIARDFLDIIQHVAETIEIPLVSDLHFPSHNEPLNECKVSNFGAIMLTK